MNNKIKKYTKKNKICQFIIQNVDNHPRDIVALTTAEFAVSRVTVSKYIRKLIAEQVLTGTGATKARHYVLYDFVQEDFRFRCGVRGGGRLRMDTLSQQE